MTVERLDEFIVKSAYYFLFSYKEGVYIHKNKLITKRKYMTRRRVEVSLEVFKTNNDKKLVLDYIGIIKRKEAKDLFFSR